MFSRRFVLLQWSLALLLTASFVLAQSAPGETLLDPQATCPQETRDSITTCLGQVEVDESQRPGGPCNDGDWPCICNKQYGLIACYAPCPGIQPAEDVTYNNNNCAGQHNGVRNGAAGGPATYSGAALTTTAPNGATGTAGSAGGATPW
ncbi:hypothetical protein IE81DRAFT_48566 [Ceraceosorus guamensis]|uniref:Thyroglobulin type-1 domain-containing protein n=1 Tax=Ceraceosorus guamensis TaxID=1522189 RepID=A0A316VUG7_9BASI|nr:hypothetical protein IE81DRAFT_48566 [Ceraceosorus guamensis]PWN39155.1 hypothetical protein IE81DRAFT_48566 [Ceraceosorus guamensis]